MQIHDIITKNRALQKYCATILKKVIEGTSKGTEIMQKLESIDTVHIPHLKIKYELKNETIDQCDQIFDKNEAQVNELEETLKAKTAQIDTTIQSILAVSPL